MFPGSIPLLGSVDLSPVIRITLTAEAVNIRRSGLLCCVNEHSFSLTYPNRIKLTSISCPLLRMYARRLLAYRLPKIVMRVVFLSPSESVMELRPFKNGHFLPDPFKFSIHQWHNPTKQSACRSGLCGAATACNMPYTSFDKCRGSYGYW
jgi:hypothetical protein